MSLPQLTLGGPPDHYRKESATSWTAPRRVGLWDRLTGIQTPPDLWLVIVTGLAALAAVGPRPLWRVSRNAVTIAHEGGHGLMALLTRRRLKGYGCTPTPAGSRSAWAARPASG